MSKLEDSASTACIAETLAGTPCKAPAQSGRPYCFTHDPETAEARLRARRKGGRKSRRRPVEVPRLATVEDVRRALEGVIGETLALSNSVQRSRALGFLLGMVLRAIEVGELEERLAALEVLAEHEPPRMVG